MIRTLLLVVGALLMTATSAVGQQHVTGTVHVQPIEIDLHLQHDTVQAGRSTRVQAVVRNHGTGPLTDATATLLAAPGGIHVRPDPVVTLGTVEGGGVQRITWQACGEAAGPDAVSYVLLVHVRATAADGRELTVESTARTLTVTPARRAASCGG